MATSVTRNASVVQPVTTARAERTAGLYRTTVYVDVIMAAHNAETTIEEAISSALRQEIPQRLRQDASLQDKKVFDMDISVCCYDDGSTDGTWNLLKRLQVDAPVLSPSSAAATRKQRSDSESLPGHLFGSIRSRLLIGQSADGISRGAGYARNRAAELPFAQESNAGGSRHRYRSSCGNIGHDRGSNGADDKSENCFICILDSDDVMHPHRISEQVSVLMECDPPRRHVTLLGCQFDRSPPDATWHYAAWANGLTDERLVLEQFREVTLIQPTWMMTRQRFERLGGYVEAPPPTTMTADITRANSTITRVDQTEPSKLQKQEDKCSNTERESNISCNPEEPLYRLVHPRFDTLTTLRVAEDLRFFHAHLRDGGRLQLHRSRSSHRLLTYRHRHGQSQSSATARRLLLQLRCQALEDAVLRAFPQIWLSPGFVIWGAGRDGKDFLKALSPEMRKHVLCMVDVDGDKVQRGHYRNADWEKYQIPIFHFSRLQRPSNEQGQCEPPKTDDAAAHENTCISNGKVLAEEGGDSEVAYGRIQKGKATNPPASVLCSTPEKKTTEFTIGQTDHGEETASSSNRRQTGDYCVATSLESVRRTDYTCRKTQSSHAHEQSTRATLEEGNDEGGGDEKDCDGDDCRRRRRRQTLNSSFRDTKRQRTSSEKDKNEALLPLLPQLPVIVCVAMYRTNGALEHNVASIGRREGVDLWHFS